MKFREGLTLLAIFFVVLLIVYFIYDYWQSQKQIEQANLDLERHSTGFLSLYEESSNLGQK